MTYKFKNALECTGFIGFRDNPVICRQCGAHSGNHDKHSTPEERIRRVEQTLVRIYDALPVFIQSAIRDQRIYTYLAPNDPENDLTVSDNIHRMRQEKE